MSNIHGLSSLNNNNSDDDNKSEENSRYVGGVSSRGGGSGLAVEPNNDSNNDDDDILGTIRSNAEVATPSSSAAAAGTSSSSQRRMITMYRSGFTIDNGPFRRLDDPSNAGFLRDLARGITPKELFDGDDGNLSGDMEVGLVDRRHMEYEEDINRGGEGSGTDGNAASSSATAAFSGVGQSLGSSTSSTAASSNGVISTSDSSSSFSAPSAVDESKPSTTIQIRLLNGKRLIVKCNLDDPVRTLVLHINNSGDGGSDDYVLSSGYPPRILDDLNKSIEECGLKGAQVVQKKA